MFFKWLTFNSCLEEKCCKFCKCGKNLFKNLKKCPLKNNVEFVINAIKKNMKKK